MKNELSRNAFFTALFVCTLALFPISDIMAQTVSFTMEEFKPLTKEWKNVGRNSLTILDETDGIITAYEVGDFYVSIIRFDHDFNIKSRQEIKTDTKKYYIALLDVHKHDDVIDVVWINVSDTRVWTLDANTLTPLRKKTLFVSNVNWKLYDVAWSSDSKYVGVRVGKNEKVVYHYYDNRFNEIVNEEELNTVKKLISFRWNPSLVYKDGKDVIYSDYRSEIGYYFQWKRVFDADEGEKLVRKCTFGFRSESYERKFAGINDKTREWLSVFIHRDRLYWIEFEEYAKGWKFKNWEYRLLLKSYGFEGECKEEVLATDIQTMPIVFGKSDGEYIIWQHKVKVDGKKMQRLGTLTIE